jgi:hypothetical protein
MNMNTEVFISPAVALDQVNTTMFRLQNALRAPATNIGDSFPLKEGPNRTNFEKELAQFKGMTLNTLLHQAATQAGVARDFCGKAAIKYWVFVELNPFEVLFPLYKQMFSVR